MNWDKIGLVRTLIYSIIFGSLLASFNLSLSQTICGGIILGLFGALIVTGK